jgi:hypothetical protein
MPATTYKGYSIPTTGTLPGTWGTEINTNSFSIIDANMGGIVGISLSNVNVSLTAVQAQNLIVRLTGVLTASVQVTIPCQGFTIIENATTGNFLVTVTNGIVSSVICRQGHRTLVMFDATNGPRVVADSVMVDLATPGAIIRSTAGVVSTDSCPAAITLSKDNNGVVIPTGIQGDVYMPFSGTLTGVTLLADVSGSMVLDIWKAAYAGYPPTIANTICASALPTLVSAIKYQDSVLTGWTTAVNAGDVLRFNVNSATSVTRFLIELTIARYT